MMPPSDLHDEEWTRYARQIGAGVLTRDAQRRLKNATVLVTRAGGIGGPAAQALVMGGVGRVIVAHGGTLHSSDLNRQVLGRESQVGQPRMPQFAEQLRALNQYVTVEAIDHEPNDEEAGELAARTDVILSCPPTFAERLRLNRVAVARRVPLVDAAQWGMTGTLSAVDPGRTACLRCLYPDEPPFEASFPVVGAISAALGCLAALEAIKILAGCGRPLFGRLWMIDSFGARLSDVALARNPACPCCGSPPAPPAECQQPAQGARRP
jgi:molybdopterin/thiamine biosynthesis adenylyltransferase